ncbi:hypothetical protein SDC9_125710 [bioreactor metagenome]|uniref:Peptidase S11 D-Ala-D-Ala carboxypeptidase A C-terminal domain-containing protein n=2 Tax=root TaxID=1 RepID=A0A645CP77_9ZZZZ
MNLLAAEDYDLLVSNEEIPKIESSINVIDKIKKPIEKNQVLGFISYSLDGKEVKKIDLLSAEELLAPEKSAKRFLKWLLWFFILYILWRTFVVYSRYLRKKRRKREAPVLFMNRRRGRLW